MTPFSRSSSMPSSTSTGQRSRSSAPGFSSANVGTNSTTGSSRSNHATHTPNTTTPNTTTATNGTASLERQVRAQILYHVDKLLLSQPPSRTSLQKLLILANPNTQQTPDSIHTLITNPVAREKAFRQLKAKLHPDKHPRDAERVTKLFQNVQQYYMDCCHAMTADGGRGNTTTTTTTTTTEDYSEGRRYSKQTYTTNAAFAKNNHTASSKYDASKYTTHNNHRNNSPHSVIPPDNFDIFVKWPLLKQMTYRETPYQSSISTSRLCYSLAYACLNLRGAICHRQAIDCTYQVPATLVNDSRLQQTHNDSSPQTIADVWQEAGFATSQLITLRGISDVQEQITRYGPVISTSFLLDARYYHSHQYQQRGPERHSTKSGNRAGYFSERHVGQTHPLLILGWTMSTQGPVWLVQALRGPTFSVGMGQFEIEQTCIAPPPSLLSRKAWQYIPLESPVWNVPDIAGKCPAWHDVFEDSSSNTTSSSSASLSLFDVTPLSSADIEALGDVWTDGVGLHAMISERRPLVLRDATKLAQSRRVIVRDVARVPVASAATSSSSRDKAPARTWKVTLSVVRK